MPVCIKCSRKKPARAFHRSPAWKSGRSSTCKSCRKRWRLSRAGAAYRAMQYRCRRAASQKAREFVLSYLLAHPCVDCGEKDPCVLTFDHVRGRKRADIARMIVNACSPETIAKELKKCVVRCANCHQRKTLRDRNAYRFRIVNGNLLHKLSGGCYGKEERRAKAYDCGSGS